MRRIRIAVMISGGGSNLQALMDAIDSGQIPAEIALVISSNKKAYGLERAKKRGIPVDCLPEKEMSEDLLSEEILRRLHAFSIDMVLLAGYLKKIPEKVVKAYKDSIINVHPSLIPAFSGKGFYGEKVHRAVHERGVKITGATVHFVNEGMDEGPIILQESVSLTGIETPEEIGKKVLEVEHRILPKAVELFVKNKLKNQQGRILVKGDGVI